MDFIRNFPGYIYRLNCSTDNISLMTINWMPADRVFITHSYLSVKLFAAALVNIDVSIIASVLKRPSQQFSQMMTCTWHHYLVEVCEVPPVYGQYLE